MLNRLIDIMSRLVWYKSKLRKIDDKRLHSAKLEKPVCLPWELAFNILMFYPISKTDHRKCATNDIFS